MSNKGNLYKTIRISNISEEVNGFKTFTLEEGHGIAYKAGQYLTLVRQQQGEEVRRSYSIISSPALNEPLAIGVKRVENGVFSRWLIDEVKTGDELLTIGSGGLFVLPDEMEQYKQLFFFAAGSGITPILSLIKTALHVYNHVNIVLVYSNASQHKAVYLEELQSLQRQFAERFHLELLFSNSVNLFRARLHRDLILELLKQYALPDKQQVLFYICGPENYMRLCTYTLQEQHIPSAHIKKENFVVPAGIRKDAPPPDQGSHTVYITSGKEKISLSVHYPDSILKAAKKQGIILPYSCEAGRCGNCVARCISGTVWHSFNEVLTERELQKGLVLTCVGHPVGGDVEIML